MSNETRPRRRCAVTKVRARKGVLLRLSLTPEGVPFVDLLGRAPGRGVYLEADRATLEEAIAPKGLGRLFRGQARVLDEEERRVFVETTISRLTARILELVSLARRANQVVIGVDAVVQALAFKGLGLVALAEDASDRSIDRVVDAISRLDEPVPMVRCAHKATIGRALGREDVGALGIRPSVFVERLVDEAERLEGLTRLCLREGN